MPIRLTIDAKEYLEHVLATERKFVHLSLKEGVGTVDGDYDITWTDHIDPKHESGRTARDGNVIAISHKYKHYFDNVLLGLDPDIPTKIIILENPNSKIKK